MPIYEYECTQCRCHFENRGFTITPHHLSRMSGKVAKKLFSGPIATLYKGGGFYVTDNRKDMDRAKQLQWDKETGKLPPPTLPAPATPAPPAPPAAKS